ncbi:hypothetical protein MHTCC0001_07020 [Flavobacteriaceae bacterium MHTCC 0001]
MILNYLKLGIFTLALFAFSLVSAQDKVTSTEVKQADIEKRLHDYKRQPDIEIKFNTADTNGDERISLEEFKAVKREKALSKKEIVKHFNRMDIIADGTVTLDEFNFYFAPK